MIKTFDPYVIAGATQQGTLPPGLNTATPVTDIRADESPDCYGLDLTKEGRIAVGTCPTGTTRIAKTYTPTAWANSTTYKVNDLVSSGGTSYMCLTAHTSVVAPGVFATDLAAGKWLAATFYWFYNRLWRMVTDATTPFAHYLWYGAPNYDDCLYEQNFPRLMLNHNGVTGGPVAICPFGTDSIGVATSTGGYIISNCADNRGFFQRTDLIQELACAAQTNMAELDGVLVVSNSNGLIAYVGDKTVELTEAVRNDLTNFGAATLTVDYPKHRIIAGTSFVYDFTTKKIYRWSGTSFRFTSRQFHAPDYAPMQIDRLVFHVEHGDTTDGTLSYEVRYEDDAWSDTYTVSLPYSGGNYSVVTEGMAVARSCRRFQVRLSALSSGKYIKEIRCDAAAFEFDGYSV